MTDINVMIFFQLDDESLLIFSADFEMLKPNFDPPKNIELLFSSNIGVERAKKWYSLSLAPLK